MAENESHVSCGRDYFSVTDIRDSLQTATQSGYDFICVPITHPRFKREYDADSPFRPGAFTRSDLLLSGSDWNSLVVGKISNFDNLESNNETDRKNATKVFLQEMRFAAHLSMPAAIVRLQKLSNPNLSRLVNEILNTTHLQQIWIQVPMFIETNAIDSNIFSEPPMTSEIKNNSNSSTWEWWNTLLTICESSKKLGLVLEVNSNSVPDNCMIDRWFGEPVKAIVFPTDMFLINKKGFPVLSKSHQALAIRFSKLNVQYIISGTPIAKDIGCYYQYLDHLYLNRLPLDPVSRFARGYEDYLQSPLQPLMDNLESQTYETFEKDPIKYALYQKAIYCALKDRVLDENKKETTIVVMVVGAGRGPLVRCTIKAAKEADRQIKLYAVEKNPNAIVTLETLNLEEWDSKVTVISSDMRLCKPEEKADIIVSELLGSFSDNELSPECLDGAQEFLKDDGISIPANYTSFIAPMAGTKLHTEVSLTRDIGKHLDAHFETPYVVRLQNINLIAEPLPCFTFEHPNRGPIDNTRYLTMEFDVKQSVTMHGFAGYFESVLYKDVLMSIHPNTHSDGMFSWFPIYFPIKTPLFIPGGEKLKVHFWRCVSSTKVWYEWCISEPYPVHIHNANGRSYFIGL